MITNWMNARISFAVNVEMNVCSFIFNESNDVTITVMMTASSTSPWKTTAPMRNARIAESSVVMP